MQEIRIFGRLPKKVNGTSAAQTVERNIAKIFNKARAAGRLTAEHEAELRAMDGDAPQLAEAAALMQEIRTFGRLPKEVKGTSEAQTAERNLAKRFNNARAAGRLTAEHEAELTAMDGDAPQLAEIAALI